ncbi:MAG: TerB family tellurite resistance protein [Algoriphagus sp.]|jgi:uncharacterized tellurite resistance protein B-like protein|nr:TerB family tellurite resistance protein [Algoriphagus sp.]MCE2779948.1 TerB family tellurite resistance protein [Algoriphagus sp.]
MTNQEIFDKLGEMGTLMLLFLEMGVADGEFTEDEFVSIIESASKFTDQEVDRFVHSAVEVAKSLSFEERVDYLNAGLAYFAGKFPANMKKGILVELARIAKADGAIHNNESALFKMAASHLGE